MMLHVLMFTSIAGAAGLDCALLDSAPSEVAEVILARPADKRLLGFDLLLELPCASAHSRRLLVARRVTELHPEDPELHRRLTLALSGDRTAQAEALQAQVDPTSPLPSTTTHVADVRAVAAEAAFLDHVATVQRCTMQVVDADWGYSLGHTDARVLFVGDRPVSRREFRRLAKAVERGERIYRPPEPVSPQSYPVGERAWVVDGPLQGRDMEVEAEGYNAYVRAMFAVSGSLSSELIRKHQPTIREALKRRGCAPPTATTLLEAHR